VSNVAESWADPAWLSVAHAWIREQVAACGRRVTGPIEQPHLRWWSTVLRVPTDGGVLWMKAARPMYAFEARVTPFLAAQWPDLTVEVLATDQQRGWMLSRDAGTRLREATDRPVVDHWAELLPAYAELQLAASEHRRQLETLGEPDRTLGQLPAELRATLEEPENLLLGEPRGLTPQEVEAVGARQDAFEADCARLAEIGIPETLQHDDLHDGNAFVRDAGYVVFDWGDSCISHPFHTLAVTLRALAYNQKLEPGGPEIQRLLDAYLEPWQPIAPAASLQEAAELARRTGTIGRAMAYRRWVAEMPAEVADEQRESIPYGLRLYLADGPWGTWNDGTL
jgi:hypothetical protein